MSERVILSDQPSSARARVIWPLVAIAIGAPFLIAGWLNPGTSFATVAAVVAVASILIADVGIVLDNRSRGGTVYMLTPTRLIRVWGGRKRYQQAVPVASIRGVTVEQSGVARLLRYGTLVIDAGADGTARMVNVPRPREWEQAILQARG